MWETFAHVNVLPKYHTCMYITNNKYIILIFFNDFKTLGWTKSICEEICIPLLMWLPISVNEWLLCKMVHEICFALKSKMLQKHSSSPWSLLALLGRERIPFVTKTAGQNYNWVLVLHFKLTSLIIEYFENIFAQ